MSADQPFHWHRTGARWIELHDDAGACYAVIRLNPYRGIIKPYDDPYEVWTRSRLCPPDKSAGLLSTRPDLATALAKFSEDLGFDVPALPEGWAL